MAKVDASGECWRWTGPKSWNGYGRLFWQGKMRRAHRLMWELVNGEIPAGMLVCHRCDNPECTKPEHLFLGTHKDNAQDRNSKGRERKIDGERHHARRLSADDVRAIRSSYAAGAVTQDDLAAQYGVIQQQISLIVSRRRWASVK
jgi:hypothetical protein